MKNLCAERRGVSLGRKALEFYKQRQFTRIACEPYVVSTGQLYDIQMLIENFRQDKQMMHLIVDAISTFLYG